MTADEQITALLKETEGLAPGKDSSQLAKIWAEVASLVDRKSKPKKWAAFHYKYAEALDPVDRPAALEAYREAVTYFDPVQDRSMWASIKACIGYDLMLLGKIAPPESEEAIACFEDAVGELPYVAADLATYYEIRTVGDPLENWKNLVHYLELALAQVTPEMNALQWAQLKNKLAMAQTSEPDGDFVKGTEKRIEYHKEALALLDKRRDAAGSPGQNLWIMSCINTSEAYAGRMTGDRATNLKECEQYARDAYNACSAQVMSDTRAMAAMGLARVLLNEQFAGSRESYREGLRLSDEAANLINAKSQPVLAATNLKFQELANLQLFKLGESDCLEPLLKAADSAYSLLDANLYADLQRIIMLIAADALAHCGQFTRAVDYLQRACDAGERNLRQATSRAGRLERIFELHDAYALLGFCHFQGGSIASGVETLDEGKGRWWNPAKTLARFEQIQTLVPAGGALLFPAFAPKEGAVAVITQKGAQVCPLKGLGSERLHEMLLADIQNPLGMSWIGRYTFRHVHPDRWYAAIDSIGLELFDLVWQPLHATLEALGVKHEAELLLFPQAGLGALPLHAAWNQEDGERRWISDRYAIRYAPAASCLLEKVTNQTKGTSLFVCDPAGDLADSALELTWVRQAEPAGQLAALVGEHALKETVLKELSRARTAHFSTHAVFRVGDPFQSSLLMAQGEHLSLEELLPALAGSSVREVILSGCETAMSQVHRRPDEFLGFPAAFLEHGAHTVVATQWPIDDWAAAAIIGRFYKEWRKQPQQSAAQAMRAAQHWLRTVTAAELLDLLLPLKQEPGPTGARAAAIRTSLRRFDKNACPYAHPYYWAAFTVSGF